MKFDNYTENLNREILKLKNSMVVLMVTNRVYDMCKNYTMSYSMDFYLSKNPFFFCNKEIC